MKKFSIFHRTVFYKICSRKLSKIIELSFLLLMLTILNLYGLKSYSGHTDYEDQGMVTGTITDNNGNSLPGVNVLLKGTIVGVISDNGGRYSIKVPDLNGTLVFSFIGYTALEEPIRGRTTINVQLNEDVTALDEVVVTALGIKREAKSLGYSTTSVDQTLFVNTNNINIGNSLTGKVAGLNVTIPPTGPGGTSKIRIRGQSSFGGNNSPLIVVNGVPINNDYSTGYGNSDLGDGLQSINAEDIESMSVLKGATAAALYGFRAKDGVIIITTKSGRGQAGIGVEVNSNTVIDEVLDFTDYQYEYGQGENGIAVSSVADARRTGVWSFGPKFDGRDYWNVDGLQHPYVPFKNRIKAFYDTGLTSTNSLAISGGDEKGNFRVSFSNSDANSIVPGTEYNKKIMVMGVNYQLSEKLSTQVNANYSIENNTNPPVVGGETFNINNTLLTLANSIDPRWMATAYKDPETGNEINPARFTPRTNMYWTINERFHERTRNRLFGNAMLRYQVTPWLYAQGRVGQDYYNVYQDYNQPTGTAALQQAAVGFNGAYYQADQTFTEVNMDFLIGANKEFGVIGFDATFGGNSMDQKSQTLSSSVTNFWVRDLYTVNNGQTKNPGFDYSWKRVNSLYGTVNLSFKDYLYLNLTGRNDWFSTLNPKSNSYLYPSASISFLLSEALKDAMPEWINFFKIRGAYAEVGGDTSPYTNSLFYSLNANTFNGIALGSISGGTSPNPDLKPLKVKESEMGMELILFNRRVSFDMSYYRKNTVDEILNVDISNTSGFSSTKVNVGRLRNQGIETLIKLVPVQKSNFNWETAINYTYNESKVLELASGQQKIDVGTGNFVGGVSQVVGMPMAMLRGVDYKRDAEGRIITANGRFQVGEWAYYGSAMPKHIGGWLNTFNYKMFRLFAQIDFKAGHKMISNTNFNVTRHGLHKNSLVGREEGGILFDGVNEDGSPNEVRVDVQNFLADYRGKYIATPFVYNASFARWRTLSASVDLTRFVNHTFIKGLTIGTSINNVLMIKKYVDNLDPETAYSASDSMAGIESSSLPTTRGYSINVNVKF